MRSGILSEENFHEKQFVVKSVVNPSMTLRIITQAVDMEQL
jgi:hypothetical protein